MPSKKKNVLAKKEPKDEPTKDEPADDNLDIEADEKSEDLNEWEREKAKIKKIMQAREESDYNDTKVGVVSQEVLCNLKGSKPEVKKVIIRKEDMDLLVDQLQVNRTTAEQFLLEKDGDLRNAVRAYIGL